jgi:NAD(P)-dependent dehydrogenase (short-subunit alcohol dehydrogenase family)
VAYRSASADGWWGLSTPAGQKPEVTEAIGSTTIMGRAARPGKIASLVAYLGSPAASYVTGALFAADGDRTAI